MFINIYINSIEILLYIKFFYVIKFHDSWKKIIRIFQLKYKKEQVEKSSTQKRLLIKNSPKIGCYFDISSTF